MMITLHPTRLLGSVPSISNAAFAERSRACSFDPRSDRISTDFEDSSKM
jgi:hypothetical protein